MNRKAFVEDMTKLLHIVRLNPVEEIGDDELIKFRSHVADYVHCVLLVRQQRRSFSDVDRQLAHVRKPR